MSGTLSLWGSSVKVKSPGPSETKGKPTLPFMLAAEEKLKLDDRVDESGSLRHLVTVTTCVINRKPSGSKPLCWPTDSRSSTAKNLCVAQCMLAMVLSIRGEGPGCPGVTAKVCLLSRSNLPGIAPAEVKRGADTAVASYIWLRLNIIRQERRTLGNSDIPREVPSLCGHSWAHYLCLMHAPDPL
jgi:hypothetical protein